MVVAHLLPLRELQDPGPEEAYGAGRPQAPNACDHPPCGQEAQSLCFGPLLPSRSSHSFYRMSDAKDACALNISTVWAGATCEEAFRE